MAGERIREAWHQAHRETGFFKRILWGVCADLVIALAYWFGARLPIGLLLFAIILASLFGSLIPVAFTFTHSWFTYPRRMLEIRVLHMESEDRLATIQERVRPVFSDEILWAHNQLGSLSLDQSDLPIDAVNEWIRRVYQMLLGWREGLAEEFWPTGAPKVGNPNAIAAQNLAHVLGRLYVDRPEMESRLHPNANLLEAYKSRLLRILEQNP